MWVIDPGVRRVAVHDEGRKPILHGEAGTLAGGTVLPGFRDPVRETLA